MKLKTFAVTAAIALATTAAAAAPASAASAPGDCKIHFETILGGICVPTP